ncbi:helix-turn-helix domain-containing protein [Actinophytocola sp.]|uniref:helix-turn-helix domain-containing protein n=1 Tax=Actinophytocola sp. TaxID=1872138 RepID=UPI002ED0C2FE
MPGDGLLLLTPQQAAALLQVRESWLRRRAAERRVPCSFVGKHLRFSRADLEAIVAAGARPPRSAGRGR